MTEGSVLHPKALIIAGGTWHAPHLAMQLDRYGLLAAVATTTPPWRFRARGNLAAKRIHWMFCPFVRGMGAFSRSTRASQLSVDPLSFAESVDRAGSALTRRLEPDVAILFAQFALWNLRTASRDVGAITVLERGGLHCLEQISIVREECAELGVAYVEPNSHLIERELNEYREADYVSVPSVEARESFVRQGVDQSRLICIPYGVDLRRFVPIPSREAKDQVRILSVGNLGIQKGTHHLVAALDRIRGRPWVLWLVGTVDAYTRELISKCDLIDRVRFWGRVDQGLLASLYREADVFAHPSLHEGMSMAVLEAAASGLPLILSTRSGYLGHNVGGSAGIIVTAGDVAGLSAALETLVVDGDLRYEMSRRAIDFGRMRPWSRYGEEWAVEIRRLVGAK